MSQDPKPPSGQPQVDATLPFLDGDDAPGRLGLMQTMFPEDLWSEVADAPVPSSEAYTLVSLLGEGGMGEVWEASQRSLHRTVAVKFVRDAGNLRLRRQFAHEANLTAGLSHPNILPVYDLVEIKGRTALVMKRVHGQAWDVHLRRHREAGTLDLAAEAQRLVQVCNAVVAAHEGGVLHLDIKPDNVMVGAHGEVLLADWGCAAVYAPSDWTRAAGLPETASIREIAGTPSFMSPEQAAGSGPELGPQTDVYLLGATLYTVLEGRDLRGSTTLEELLVAIAQPAELSFSATTPRSLQQLCEASLSVDPQQRPETAAAFRDALQHWLDHRASEALVLEADLQVARAEETGDGAWGAWTAALQLCQQALVLSPDSALASAWVATAHGRLAVLALDRQEPGLAREHAEALAEGAERQRLLADATALHRSQQQSQQAQRWLRRVSVGAAVLVAGALVLVSLFYLESERSLEHAEAVSDFNGRILSGLDPNVAGSHDTTLLEEILDKALNDANRRFSADPVLRGEVLLLVGQAFKNVQSPRAREVLTQSHNLLVAQEGPDASGALLAEFLLENLDRTESELGTDRTLEAAQDRVARAVASLGPQHEVTLTLQYDLAVNHNLRDEPEPSKALVEEALRNLPDPLRGGPLEVNYRRLLVVLLLSDEPDSALQMHSELIAEQTAQEGPDSYQVLQLRMSHGAMLGFIGRSAEATKELEEVLGFIESAYAPDHAIFARWTRLYLFTLEQRLAASDPAAATAAAAFVEQEIERLASEEEPPRSLAFFESILLFLNELRADEEVLRLTSAVASSSILSEASPETAEEAGVWEFRSAAFVRMGRSEEALMVARKRLGRATQTLGWDHWATIGLREAVATAQLALGDPARAAELHLENKQQYAETLGPDHPAVAASALGAAQAFAALGEGSRVRALVTEVGSSRTAMHSLRARGAGLLAEVGQAAAARQMLQDLEEHPGERQMDATFHEEFVLSCEALRVALVDQDGDTLRASADACRDALSTLPLTRGLARWSLPYRALVVEAMVRTEGPEAAARGATQMVAVLEPVLAGAALPADAAADWAALRRQTGQ